MILWVLFQGSLKNNSNQVGKEEKVYFFLWLKIIHIYLLKQRQTIAKEYENYYVLFFLFLYIVFPKCPLVTSGQNIYFTLNNCQKSLKNEKEIPCLQHHEATRQKNLVNRQITFHTKPS